MQNRKQRIAVRLRGFQRQHFDAELVQGWGTLLGAVAAHALHDGQVSHAAPGTVHWCGRLAERVERRGYRVVRPLRDGH
jgi:hypothetical protein